MRIYGSLRIASRQLGAALLGAVLLGGCGGAVNVVSEGGDSDLMLRGNDAVAYFTAGRAVVEMDQERNLKLAWHYWETEVQDSNWRLQAWKRLLWRVPHYKSNAELAEEYEKRFGKKPG